MPDVPLTVHRLHSLMWRDANRRNELLRFDLDDAFDRLSTTMVYPVDREDVREALEWLLEEGWVERTEQGWYRMIEPCCDRDVEMYDYNPGERREVLFSANTPQVQSFATVNPETGETEFVNRVKGRRIKRRSRERTQKTRAEKPVPEWSAHDLTMEFREQESETCRMRGKWLPSETHVPALRKWFASKLRSGARPEELHRMIRSFWSDYNGYRAKQLPPDPWKRFISRAPELFERMEALRGATEYVRDEDW